MSRITDQPEPTGTEDKCGYASDEMRRFPQSLHHCARSFATAAASKPYRAENLARATGAVGFLKIQLAGPSALAQADANTLLGMVTEEDVKDATKTAAALASAKNVLPASLPISAAWLKDFKGGKGSLAHLYPEGAGVASRVGFVGLGAETDADVEAVKKATHAAVSYLKKIKETAGAIVVPAVKDVSRAALFDAITRVVVLSSHSFNKYKKDPKPEDAAELEKLTLVCESDDEAKNPEILAAIQKAQIISEGTVFAREMANDRADKINPETMEQLATAVANANGLKLTVVDAAKLKEEGLNLILAVGAAAAVPPRIVVLEYNGDPANPTQRTALVGKGITFDTGGLNLKPTGAMEEMHLDMSGSAAVLAAIKTAAAVKVQKNIVAVLALAENAIGPLATKPHTIVHSVKGSVEVNNTDAEGRLALADAFTYVQKHYAPQRMFDLATLTGACVVALGEYAAGLFSNNKNLQRAIQDSGDRVFERCWPMPIFSEHSDELKGQYSDMRSTGKGRWGGACTAAAFLKNFVEKDVEWAHIDIAGPAMYSAPRDWMPVGGTGFGVQLLIDALETLPAPAAK